MARVSRILALSKEVEVKWKGKMVCPNFSSNDNMVVWLVTTWKSEWGCQNPQGYAPGICLKSGKARKPNVTLYTSSLSHPSPLHISQRDMPPNDHSCRAQKNGSLWSYSRKTASQTLEAIPNEPPFCKQTTQTRLVMISMKILVKLSRTCCCHLSSREWNAKNVQTAHVDRATQHHRYISPWYIHTFYKTWSIIEERLCAPIVVIIYDMTLLTGWRTTDKLFH